MWQLLHSNTMRSKRSTNKTLAAVVSIEYLTSYIATRIAVASANDLKINLLSEFLSLAVYHLQKLEGGGRGQLGGKISTLEKTS